LQILSVGDSSIPPRHCFHGYHNYIGEIRENLILIKLNLPKPESRIGLSFSGSPEQRQTTRPFATHRSPLFPIGWRPGSYALLRHGIHKLGATYLQKPFSLGMLARKVHNTHARHRFQRTASRTRQAVTSPDQDDIETAAAGAGHHPIGQGRPRLADVQ
jgi:hypothetical protein